MGNWWPTGVILSGVKKRDVSYVDTLKLAFALAINPQLERSYFEHRWKLTNEIRKINLSSTAFALLKRHIWALLTATRLTGKAWNFTTQIAPHLFSPQASRRVVDELLAEPNWVALQLTSIFLISAPRQWAVAPVEKHAEWGSFVVRGGKIGSRWMKHAVVLSKP